MSRKSHSYAATVNEISEQNVKFVVSLTLLTKKDIFYIFMQITARLKL